jgi:cytochrome c oxidase subunit III
MRIARKVGDVSGLPQNAFGAGSITWWGMMGLILAEGITLILLAASYLYIRHNFYSWPPEPAPLPRLGIATVSLLLYLVSVVPAWMAARRARAHDRRGVLIALIVQAALGVVCMVLRYFETRALGIRWDTNAYGSVAWAVLVGHALVAVTDVIDTIGLATLFWRVEPEERHYVDTTENSIFWYFIVASWVPLYVLVFLYPRWR